MSGKAMVGILALAARGACEQALGAYLHARLACGSLPGLHELEQHFDPTPGRDGELETFAPRAVPSTRSFSTGGLS